MVEPIVFISVSRIVEPNQERFARALAVGADGIAASKPRTALFGAYVDDSERELRIVHAFPDASAMTMHFAGAQDRTRAAASFLAPMRFEVYGEAPSAALALLADEAAGAGGTVTTWRAVAGFLRPPPVSDD
jgi:hypothetical protein